MSPVHSRSCRAQVVRGINCFTACLRLGPGTAVAKLAHPANEYTMLSGVPALNDSRGRQPLQGRRSLLPDPGILEMAPNE